MNTRAITVLTDVSLITCIVQRGLADNIIKAAQETGAVLTAEEHQVGGLGNIVAGVIASEQSLFDHTLRFGMLGVADRFGESGQSWQLIKHFGLAAEHVAARAKELLEL